MNRAQVPFESWLREAFSLYRKYFVTLLLSHMALLGVAVFSLGILAGPMAAGVVRITLDLLDDRRPVPQPGDIFQGMRYFLPSFLLAIAVGLGSWAATRLLQFLHLGPLALFGPVLPLTATWLALFLIVESGMEFGPAIQTSWERVRPIFWPIAGLLAIGWGITLIGLLLFYVGISVTLPFYTCLTAVAWRHLDEMRPVS